MTSKRKGPFRCHHCGATTRRHPDGLCWICRYIKRDWEQKTKEWFERAGSYAPVAREEKTHEPQ